MNYLYHGVPEDMKGHILYPLNRLKEIYPELYDIKKLKYEGREEVMDQKVPGWNCLWNDVLHLTAVNPNELRKTYKSFDKHLGWKFYKIPVEDLDKDKLKVYLYNQKQKELNSDKHFKDFNEKDLKDYSYIPQETLNYYKEKFDANENPLIFHRIPHVFYKGEIDISKYEIV